MILIGLVLVGVLRPRLTLGVGERIAASAAERLRADATAGRIRPRHGLVLIAARLNDTIVYWFV